MNTGMTIGNDLVNHIGLVPKEGDKKPWSKTFSEAFTAIKQAPLEVKVMGILGGVCLLGAGASAFGFMSVNPTGLTDMSDPLPSPTPIASNKTSNLDETYDYPSDSIIIAEGSEVDLNCNSLLRDLLIVVCSSLTSAGLVGTARWAYYTATNLPNAKIEAGLVKGTNVLLVGYGKKSVTINFKDASHTHEMISLCMDLFKYALPRGVEIGEIYDLVVDICDAVDRQLGTTMAGTHVLNEIQLWLDRTHSTSFKEYRDLVGLDSPTTPMLWARGMPKVICDGESDYAEIIDMPPQSAIPEIPAKIEEERPTSLYVARRV